MDISNEAIAVIVVLVLVVLLWYNSWKVGKYDLSSYIPGEGMAVQPMYADFLGSDRLHREGMAVQPAYGNFLGSDRLRENMGGGNRYYLGGY